jgi:hypothetical protein
VREREARMRGQRLEGLPRAGREGSATSRGPSKEPGQKTPGKHAAWPKPTRERGRRIPRLLSRHKSPAALDFNSPHAAHCNSHLKGQASTTPTPPPSPMHARVFPPLPSLNPDMPLSPSNCPSVPWRLTQKLVRQLRPCTSSTRRRILRKASSSFCKGTCGMQTGQ